MSESEGWLTESKLHPNSKYKVHLSFYSAGVYNEVLVVVPLFPFTHWTKWHKGVNIIIHNIIIILM